MSYTSLRTTAVGMILGGYFMTYNMYVVSFLQRHLKTSPLISFSLALKTLSSVSASALGADLIIPLSWAALCIGAGLFVSSIVWPAIEDVIYAVFRKINTAMNKISDRMADGMVERKMKARNLPSSCYSSDIRKEL